jgi:hypothetical protein
MYATYEEAKADADAAQSAFPKFLGATPSTNVHTGPVQGDDGARHQYWSLTMDIPLRCRLAAMFEDLDYSAPWWAIALTFYASWSASEVQQLRAERLARF